jgi:glycerol-3-phosphate dehydrogenase (NAD(P)+)
VAAVSVLGAGAWGTALAAVLAPRHAVMLWARDAAQARAIAARRRNERYLPALELPAALQVTSQFDHALAHAAHTAHPAGGLLIFAAPTAALGETVRALRARHWTAAPFLWLCKGLEQSESRLAHEIVNEALGPMSESMDRGPLSGPSFAIEVARGLPAALTVAGAPGFCDRVTRIVHHGALRVYSSDDVIGVEIGGAVKNVMAIATGISDALALGHNARAALITRGLAEIVRFGAALGARAETLAGLAGVGDLILTCTGDLSRNRQVGLLLGAGRPLADALREIGHVAEGVRSAAAVAARARALGVQMPLTDAVCAVLDGCVTPQAALARLLERDPRREH